MGIVLCSNESLAFVSFDRANHRNMSRYLKVLKYMSPQRNVQVASTPNLTQYQFCTNGETPSRCALVTVTFVL